MADDRAVVPVVGKALEVALVVLLVSVLTASLFGTAVPTYRSSVGSEVGDRSLQYAANEVEGAARDAARTASEGQATAAEQPTSAAERVAVEVDVPLPRTIRGSRYRVRTSGGALRLDHPHPTIGERARLSLPAGARLSGTWRSGSETSVAVSGGDGAIRVRLVNR